MLKTVNTDESNQRMAINRDTYCVHVLEYSIQLRCYLSSNSSIDLMQCETK